MRQVIAKQMKIGEVGIANIVLDIDSRDDIPQLLMGLQYIYTTPDVRKEVFEILETMIKSDVSSTNGRPGMDLWKIFVMGTLRLNLNYDYDRLREEVNNHTTIRQMLGHDIFDLKKYPLQTIKDNVKLLNREILIKCNVVVVKSGHSLIIKNHSEKIANKFDADNHDFLVHPTNDESIQQNAQENVLSLPLDGQKNTNLLDDKLIGRCDSFVVETDVEYPTDINLLFEAVRKAIELISVVCAAYKVNLWGEIKYDINKIRRLCRAAQNAKKSTSNNDEQKKSQDERIKDAHIIYIDQARHYLSNVLNSIMFLKERFKVEAINIPDMMWFISSAYRLIDQIERRVLNGETIPHNEKIFSLFEEYTEWISKGKVGVPMELGLKVCILEDQYGFILNHQIMRNISDSEIAVDFVRETQTFFPDLEICSFDKGFYSTLNKGELDKLLDLCILPKKGKLSQTEQLIENEELFKIFRRKHSAVESAINALEVHGLDKCYDHGIEGFERYVALAVVARNIQKIGSIIQNNYRNKKKAA